MTGQKWFSNTSRLRLDQLLRSFGSNIPAGSRVLDAGAGDQSNRQFFSQASYDSADFEAVGAHPLTYVCDLAEIPTESNYFDYIIFNQVLEYISDPQRVINELCRVLKKGGTILCTCPFFYEEDDERPYDFARYTRNGLNKMFASAGFEIVSIDPLEGYLTTLSYQLESAFRHLPATPSKIGSSFSYVLCPFFWAIKVMAFFLAAVLYRVDRLDGLHKFGYPKNYVVLARKKDRREETGAAQ